MHIGVWIFWSNRLSIQHLNADVRYNNNAQKEYDDCIGGLLHLGLNVITFRNLLHLAQLLHLGLQQCAHQVHSVRLSNQ